MLFFPLPFMVPNFTNLHPQVFGCKSPLLVGSVCLFISIFLFYDPWVDKIFCSLGYRLRSRVALGVGIVSNNVL